MTEETQSDEAGGEALPDSVNKDITEDSQDDETAAEAISDPASTDITGDSQDDETAAEALPDAQGGDAGPDSQDDETAAEALPDAEDGDAGPSQGDATEVEPSEAIRGAVKWFNAEKGFGFIVPEDGSADIFLHHSTLRDMGLKSVDGGATIVCEVSQGPKGLQVARVIEVDDSTATPTVRRRPRSPLGYDRPRHESLTDVGEFVIATVKWFNPNKGFGFITVNDDSRDVFIHMQTLRRCGIAALDRGQEVRVRIGQSSKGPQVAEIAPI